MNGLVTTCLLLISLPTAAAAKPITYQLTGTVTFVNGAPVSIGQQIAITFVVDDSYPRRLVGPREALYAGGSESKTPDPIISATINGVPVVGSSDGIYIQKYVQHTSALDIFVNNSQPGSSLVVGFLSTLSDAVQNLKIPLVVAPNRFQGREFGFFSGPPSYYYYKGTINLSPYLPPL